MKNRRQFGETYIVRKVSRICFWLHDHLVQPQPWSLPFCLQVIVVISWLSSTLCSHRRERQSEFPHDQVPKRWGPLFRFSYRPGFPAPLCFSDLSTRAIYHGPRRKLVLAAYLHSTWEQHTVVYPKGKNLFKTSCSNGWPYFNRSVLDPGQVPEIKRVTRSSN